ncbi:MAG: 1-phosphofructokinase [Candidatus Hydrogenedentota bacterium]
MVLTVTPNPCVDKTVFINRLEAGTFMRSQRYTCIAGGKGTNVSRALTAMGYPTKAMAVVGGHTGAHVIDMIEKHDRMPCVPAWVDSPTRTITTILEEPIHRQTAFFEPGSQVTEGELTHIVQVFREAVAGATWVTFNGTVSDKSIRTLYKTLIPIAHEAGAKTILDSHGPELKHGLEAAPFMVKPNVAEAEELLGRSLDSHEARMHALDAFHEQGVALVALSLGPDGVLASYEGKRVHGKPPAIQEINPVGSGDCLVAGFCIGLMNDWPLEETVRLACAMGTANAMSWDIGHFDPHTIQALREQVSVVPLG